MSPFLFLIPFYLIVFVSCRKVTRNATNEIETKLELIKYSGHCGQVIEEEQFLLESMNYPEKYPSNSNCEITLKGEECPFYYKFQFLDFDIENSTGCVKDRIEIGLTDALCGMKDGTKSYLAGNGTLKIRFVSDELNERRGYKILVTKQEECIKNTPNIILNSLDGKNDVNPILKKCCSNQFGKSKYFTFRSPNFPVSMSSINDCIFEIHKFSQDICRLRIKFKFFWFGNSLDCREGFLEIDRKKICGCRAELNLISSFPEQIKSLRFKSEGLVKNSYSGYIAEVFQDDCPKKLELQSVQNSNETKSNSPYFSIQPKEVTDVYFYTYPEETIYEEEKEETNFFEVENITTYLGNNVKDYQNCLRWNQAQFDYLSSGQGFQLEQCERDNGYRNMQDRCSLVFQQKGIIFSPGYPLFYPGSINICYRFPRLPGHCGVRIHFLDFRIGYSEGCIQDHLKIGPLRIFCGMELWNKIVILDLSNKESEDVRFVTSFPRCFHGFKAIYTYLPCQERTTELPPLPPFTRIQPIYPTTTIRPVRRCGGEIREEFFTILNEEWTSECVFIIRKFSEDVCRIQLTFEKHDIDCPLETLTINGRTYCGSSPGRIETIDIFEDPVKVIYRKSGLPASMTRFRIQGRQVYRDCYDPLPPAQLNK